MRHVTAQQLSAFLDGALSGVSRELVTRHLAACADCRERHALWHIYDEVLQRVLSWEPDEHTMEEASARVELALTAERRGLKPPEFTSVLNPAPPTGPHSPSASGMFPSLPPIAPAATATWRVSSPTPAPPPPAPPAPVQITITPSANAYPLDPPQYAAPPAPPQNVPPPAQTQYAPPPTPPVAPTQWYPPPAPPVAPAQWYPPPSPPGGAAQWYAPPPPPGYAPPISAREDLRPHAAPAAPWPSAPSPPKKSGWGLVLWVTAALIGLVLLASPWLPDVIRIHQGSDANPPTVELVRHDGPPATGAPDARLAERTSSEPPAEPYRALPTAGDSAAERSTAVEPPHADSVPPPPPIVAPAPKPATAAKPHTPARIRPRTTPDDASRSEDEGGTAAGAEHSMTFIPVQVKTEVQLSPPKAASTPAPAMDTVGDRTLPLLCGDVVDDSGAPIEGARIQVMAPSLTVRTDKRGRFCVALPAGEHTFLVDAAGFSAVTRGVELTGGTFETHVTLAAVH